MALVDSDDWQAQFGNSPATGLVGLLWPTGLLAALAPPPAAPADMRSKVTYGLDPNSPAFGDVGQAGQGLQDRFDALAPKINALSDSEVITIPGEGTVTGAEVKQALSALNFNVTERDFGQNKSGANVGGSVEINVPGVTGYAKLGVPGFNYLILHELGHMVGVGNQAYDDNWRAFLNEGGHPDDYANSPQFMRGERSANRIARAVAEKLRERVLDNPYGGY